jgi:hypothetical protein
MRNEKITTSDKKLISEVIKCSVRQVNHIVGGKRGKQNTELQQRIKHAIAIREQQNTEFCQLCMQKAIQKVSPTTV